MSEAAYFIGEAVYFIGIDPGEKGAISCIKVSKDGIKPKIIDSPIKYYKDSKGNSRTDVDPNAYANIIISLIDQGIPNENIFAALERVWIYVDHGSNRHKSGIAMSKLVRSGGIWEGILFAHLPPQNIQVPTSRTWKSQYDLNGSYNSVTEKKQASIDKALEIFSDDEEVAKLVTPEAYEQNVMLCANRAESLLIANFAMSQDWKEQTGM